MLPSGTHLGNRHCISVRRCSSRSCGRAAITRFRRTWRMPGIVGRNLIGANTKYVHRRRWCQSTGAVHPFTRSRECVCHSSSCRFFTLRPGEPVSFAPRTAGGAITVPNPKIRFSNATCLRGACAFGSMDGAGSGHPQELTALQPIPPQLDRVLSLCRMQTPTQDLSSLPEPPDSTSAESWGPRR